MPSNLSDDSKPEAETAPTSTRNGPVAILCRRCGEIGRILTDRKPSSTKALLVSFDDGARLEEVPLSEIELLEVIDA